MDFKLTQYKHYYTLAAFIALYCIWLVSFVGFRQDHIYFLLVIASAFVLHRSTRIFAYCSIYFILFWIIYDAMRISPNYLWNDIHILEPYNIEKLLFGLSNTNGEIMTPNEYLRIHAHSFLDLLTGFFYLTWVPLPFMLGMYFFIKNRPFILRFGAAFLFTNLLGFFIYYIYPAAPPWYYDIYGTTLSLDIPGNAASLLRFDDLIEFPLFENMYTKNANVFAAIPSLHAAYPLIAFYYAYKNKLKLFSLILAIDCVGIWFSAVYSFHHYFIDVLMGIFCAIVALIIFEKVLYKKISRFIIDKYLRYIES